MSAASNAMNIGFLTVLREDYKYLGGYLVTNRWGRPLEFRLTSAVQPNRVQQILYANTLDPYLCADLIGKTLVEKTPVAVDMIVTDTRSALDLRLQTDTPVAWVDRTSTGQSELSEEQESEDRHDLNRVQDDVYCHPRYKNDGDCIAMMLKNLIGTMDLAEPFQRIREAMGEATRAGIKR